MHILYLSADRGIPVRGHKGAAVHVRALTDALLMAGHRVTIFTPRPGPTDGPTPRAEVIDCPLPTVAADDASAADCQAQAYTSVLVAAALAWLASNPCDAIYERYSLWSDAGARLRAVTGLPLILEVNAPLRIETARHRHLGDDARAAQIETAQFAAADHVAVVSQPLAHYVTAHGARAAKVHVVPNAVDPQHFHPAVRGGDVRARYGLHGRTVVGFAGRMRPWHDGPTLLRAFQRLHAADPAYHLLLVGEMPPELLAAIEAAGLMEAVTCTGPVPHREVPEHLAAMDVAVSSHAVAEAGETFYFSPLKLFEYLACGVPTVAADVGQPGELIRPGYNGYLYPPGDDAALAAAIRTLVADPAHARAVAWNGATLVLQAHTWAQNAARVAGWLETQTSGGAGITSIYTSGAGVHGQPFHRESTHSSLTPAPAPDGLVLPILDATLRQRLYRATRADLAAPLLARQLPGFGKKGPDRLQRIEAIEVLKYKPGRRCVLAYQLAGCDQSSHQRVIGKVFRDERGQRLFALQDRLWRSCGGPNGVNGISVPQPLAYVPEMRMLVQASAPGRRLDELSLAGPIHSPVLRSAEALAWLHGDQVLGRTPDNSRARLEPYTLADELRGLDHYAARLAVLRPDARPAVQALHAALLDWAARLPPAARTTPLHRDFYYSQVLFDGPHLVLIDFDLLAWGDPAIDVANFSAHLAYLGLEQFGDLSRFASEMVCFCDRYAATGRSDFSEGKIMDADFAERLAFYQASTFFRLLSVVAPRPAVSHLFEPLLAHTHAALQPRAVMAV